MPRPHCRPLPEFSKKDIARFWTKVQILGPEECWPWIGQRSRDGYGLLRYCRENHPSTLYANRIAFFLERGFDPYPLETHHSCDYPPCCNARHLSAGTPKQNAEERNARGRHARGLTHGCHELTEAEVEEIRRRYAYEETNQKLLASEYGVRQGTIYNVVSGNGWAHLPIPSDIRIMIAFRARLNKSR